MLSDTSSQMMLANIEKDPKLKALLLAEVIHLSPELLLLDKQALQADFLQRIEVLLGDLPQTRLKAQEKTIKTQ
ncbi:15736_t:CDS:2, partial [Racocetra fulgida]